jgi:exonuclease SbcD
MRIAVVADSHYFELSRFEECIRLHNWIAQDARARGCSRWLHAGDVYERKSTPRERDAVASWVQEMTECVGPGVIVRGNHDAIDDLPLLQRLETKRQEVVVVEGAQVVDFDDVAIACLAWPQRGRLAALLPDRSKEEVEQAAGEALRAVLRGLGDQLAACDEGVPRLFLAHAMVRGSITSTGQPLVGCDFELGLEDLALCRGADAYLLGHIHKGQSWEINGAPVIYPGSPRRTAFGELEAKGYVVLDCDGHGVRWEFVEAPATKMVQLEGRFEHGVLERDDADVQGAEVRLRYTVAPDEREAARATAEGARDMLISVEGAVSVKVEEVVESSTRSRTPEVARAVTLTDKLEALWTARGFEPGDRRNALIGKVLAVESEVLSAA